MKRRRMLVVSMFVVVALVSFASGAAIVVASKGSDKLLDSPAATVAIDCPSPSLGGRLPALVYLPMGYRGSGKRYPVVYFLHGLPADPTSYESNRFVANRLAASGRSAVVVAPQGARSTDSDREYLNWDATEDWPAAISKDLVRCIDSRYRTIHRRAGRALVGLSAGGFGALDIGLRTLSVFGAVESWSGYFVATDPSGYHVLNLGSAQANNDATVPRGAALTKALQREPSLVAFYVGQQDARFLTMNRQYHASLAASHIRHVFRVYTGGHTETLWSTHAGAWLDMALDALAAERTGARRHAAQLDAAGQLGA